MYARTCLLHNIYTHKGAYLCRHVAKWNKSYRLPYFRHQIICRSAICEAYHLVYLAILCQRSSLCKYKIYHSRLPQVRQLRSLRIASTAEGRLMRFLVRSQRQMSPSSCRSRSTTQHWKGKQEGIAPSYWWIKIPIMRIYEDYMIIWDYEVIGCNHLQPISAQECHF